VNLFMSIRRIAREKWSIKTHIIETLYKAVALPIVTYGAAGWFDKVGHSMVQRHLVAMQRALLLVLTKACRTTSTVAMQILHGKVSLDLEITRRGILAKIKRNLIVTWEGFNYTTTDNKSAIDLDLKKAKLSRAIYTVWQSRWDTTDKGRDNFINEVTFAKDHKWFKPNKELVYITGYAPINSSLHKRGLINDSRCIACDTPETVNHLLFECEL